MLHVTSEQAAMLHTIVCTVVKMAEHDEVFHAKHEKTAPRSLSSHLVSAVMVAEAGKPCCDLS